MPKLRPRATVTTTMLSRPQRSPFSWAELLAEEPVAKRRIQKLWPLIRKENPRISAPLFLTLPVVTTIVSRNILLGQIPVLACRPSPDVAGGAKDFRGNDPRDFPPLAGLDSIQRHRGVQTSLDARLRRPPAHG